MKSRTRVPSRRTEERRKVVAAMGMDCGAVKERMEMGSAEEGKEMVSLEMAMDRTGHGGEDDGNG